MDGDGSERRRLTLESNFAKIPTLLSVQFKQSNWKIYCYERRLGYKRQRRLKNNDGDCSKNVTWEVNLCCLTLNITAVIPAPSLVKWTRISWSWILREFIQFHKENEQNSLPWVFRNLSNKAPFSLSSICPLNPCSFKQSKFIKRSGRL